MDFIKNWIKEHPARAAAIAGWYQQLCGILPAIVTIPFILKKLAADEAGLWFAFQGFLAAITLTDFGFSFVISRQVSYTLCKGNGGDTKRKDDFIETAPGWEGVRNIYRAGRMLFGRISGIGILLLIILYELVLPHTKLALMQNVKTAVAWYLLGLATIISLQAKLNQSVIEGAGKMYLTKFMIGTFQILNGAFIIAVLLIVPTLPAISLVVLTIAALQYISLKLALNLISENKLKGYVAVEKAIVSKLWRVAAPIGIVSSASYCITSVQVPMVGAILGAEKVTPFYLAQRIAMVIMQAVSQLSQPQVPLFTMDYSRPNFNAARQRMKKTITVVTGAVLLGFTIFYFASPAVVNLWVGEGKYVEGNVLLIMSVDYSILGVAGVWANFVLASGRNPFVVSTIINAVLNLILTATLCKLYGLIGLPISTLICGLLTNYWYSPYQGLKLWREISK
ncbi:MAG: hypothetical protein ACP5MG_01620 [Verrucomicrobiia bacterium]|jgi:O-antigen/teichoic acid export membrane protein